MQVTLYSGPATREFNYCAIYDKINEVYGSTLVHRSLALDKHITQGDIWCVWNIQGVTVVYTQRNEFKKGRVTAELILAGYKTKLEGIERKMSEALGLARKI